MTRKSKLRKKTTYERIFKFKGEEGYCDIKHHFKVNPDKKEVTCCLMLMQDGKIIESVIRSVRCSEMDVWDPIIGIALSQLKCDVALEAYNKTLFLGGKASTGSWRKFKEWAQDKREEAEEITLQKILKYKDRVIDKPADIKEESNAE